MRDAMPPDLPYVLQELENRQLVRPLGEDTDTYQFKHTLTQEAAYRALLIKRRRGIHRLVAKAYEAYAGERLDEHAAILAYHYGEAGDDAQALAYALRAGEVALSVHANPEAVEHFSRALEAARRLAAQGEPLPTSLHRILRSSARARELLGDFPAAQQDHEAALHAATVSGDRTSEWQSLVDLGLFWAAHDYEKTRSYYEQALQLARTTGDADMLAHSLNREGNWYTNVDRPFEAQRRHQQALAIFEQTGNTRGLAESLDFLGMASALGGDTIQGAAHYQRALLLYRQLGDALGVVSSQATLGFAAPSYQAGYMTVAVPLAEGRARAEKALALAREIGWRSGEAYCLMVLADLLGPQGEYGAALSAGMEGLQVAREINHRQWQAGVCCILGITYVDLLAAEPARSLLEEGLEIGKEVGSLHWSRTASGPLAIALAMGRQFDTAEAVLDAAYPADAPVESLGQRLVTAGRVELALARGDPATAIDLAARLAPMDETIETGPFTGLLQGRSLLALGQVDRAVVILENSRSTAARYGTRCSLWRTLAALGKAYAALGERARAEEMATQAGNLVQELSANIPDSGLRENFLSRAAALIAGP